MAKTREEKNMSIKQNTATTANKVETVGKNIALMRSKKTPKKVRQSIKLDPVNPTDFLTYSFTHSCESCSHWNQDNGLCTLGYKNDVHRLEANLKCYEINGKMAFCRFLEID
jgi:hypothetical protein